MASDLAGRDSLLMPLHRLAMNCLPSVMPTERRAGSGDEQG
jgi:hypothetical protein